MPARRLLPQVTSTHLSSALPVNQGGTGSTSQNFVDLSTAQTIGGDKNLTGATNTNSLGTTTLQVTGGTLASGKVLTSDSSGNATWNSLPSAPVVSVAGKVGAVTLATTDLTDVSVTTPLNNQVLTYDSTNNKWVNQTPAVGIQLDTTASDIQALGVQAAGSIGKAADSGHVHTMPRLDQVSAPLGSVSLNSQKVTNLANGSVSSDAANFGQVPTSAGSIGGLLATNNLSDVADNGTSRSNLRIGLLGSAQAVSTTNIASLSGLPVVDSYTLLNSDVVLLVGQTTQSQNGPWQMPASGSGAWIRPTDYATGASMRGRMIEVNGGTQWSQTVWAMASTSSITVDTTATTWQCVTLPNPSVYEGYWLTNDGVNPVWSPAPSQSIRAQNAIFRFSNGLTAGAVSESYHIWDAGGLSRGPQVQIDEPSSNATTLQVDVQYETSPGAGWTSIFGAGPFPTIAQNTTLIDGSAPSVTALSAGSDIRGVILQTPPGPTSNPSAASFVANNNSNSGSSLSTSYSPSVPGSPQSGDIVVLVIAEQGQTISLPSGHNWVQYGQITSSSPFNVTNCSTISGSNQLTVSSGTGIVATDVISGTNIPTGTTVSSIVGTTVTMSNNASGTSSGLTITFTPPVQNTLSLWAAPWSSGISLTFTMGGTSPADWWVGLLRGGDSTTVSNSIVQTATYSDGNSPGLGTGTVTGAGLTADAAADIVLVMASARYLSGDNGYTLSSSGGPTGLGSSADIVTSRSSGTNVGLYVGIASAVTATSSVAAATFTATGGTGSPNNIADTAMTALFTRVAGTTGPSVCTIQQPIDG